MGRGIPLRILLVGLTLCFGLLVLFLALSGAADALRDSGIVLEWGERSRLTNALLSTQLVRGLFGIGLALLLAGAVGGAASRLFDSLRSGSRESARQGSEAQVLWLREAQELADALGWTEEEHAQHLASLSRSRDELDRLLEAVSEGIVQLDGSGRVVRANRAARRLLALPDDVEGRQIGTVVRSAELRTLLQRAAVEEALPPREIAFEERTLIVTARMLSPVASSSAPGGLAVAIADLTALRRLESVRRDFVANASHELKTPLTSIRGYAETLLDDDLPAETRRQFIETISGNAERLQHIVDDLLDLSRLESGSWQPVLEAIAPAAAVRQAWQDFEERATRIGVDFDVQEETSDRALADPSALRQILSNLYDNALRFTQAGDHILVRITEWQREAGEPEPRDRRLRFLAIEVRDTGAGIPGDALPRIFERFYRVDPARSRADGGTGLGLAIVKHLTESMGGSVEAESQLGRGTTIRIVLPVASDGGAATVAAA